MNQIPLSRPIASHTPAGTLYPWERPYSTEPIATLAHNGANLFHIDMSPAASTRLVTARISDAEAPSITELAPELLLNRLAAVVRVEAAADGQISEEQIRSALDGVEASALVLLAGEEASLTPAAFAALGQALAERSIDLVLTDLAYLTTPDESFVGRTWLAAPAWQRPPWPSSSAKAYIEYEYDRERALTDWQPTLSLLEVASFVLGLVNGERLTAATAVVNVAPLQVADVGEAPCTVVASIAT